MAFKMKGSPYKNYANPQEYKVFNWGNKPTPMKLKRNIILKIQNKIK